MPAATVQPRSSAAPPSPFPNTIPDSKSPFGFSAFTSENREGVSSSATRTGSMAPGRSRPRLVKLRRQAGAQQVRSRSVATEAALGFNPFRSVSVSSDGVNNDGSVFTGVLDDSSSVISGPSSSGGLDFSNIDVQSGKVEKNSGFVFSAKRDDSAVNLNSGESDSGGGAGGSGTDDWGNFNIQRGSESNKFEDVGFVFGAKQDNLKSDSSSEKEQSCNNGGDNLFNDKGNVKIESEGDRGKFGGAGLVFSLGADINLGKRESSECAVKSSFFAGDYQNSSASSLNSKMGKASNNLGKPISNGGSQFEVGSETVIGGPSMEEQGHAEYTEKPGDSNRNQGGKAELRNCDDHSFVFGASWSKLASNPNLEEKESSGNIKQSGFNHTGKSVAGSSNEAFVFQSSSSKNYVRHGNESKEFPLRTDELNNGKMQDSNLGSAADHTNIFEFGSSGNVDCASSSNPQFKLPDEMKKLNISDFGNIDGPEKTNDSSMNSCKHDGPKFVFGSVQNATDPSHGVLGTTCPNPGPECPPQTAVEGNNEGDTLKTNYQNSFMSERANGAKTASGVSTPNPHIFQAGPTENVSSFTTGPDGLGVPITEFKTPQWDPSGFKSNLFPEASKKLEFSAKSRSVKDKRFKKKKGKLRPPSLTEHSGRHNHVHHESGSQENSDYSPMDFSPYEETSATDQWSEQIPMTSNESSHIDMKCGPSASDTAVTANFRSEELATSRENLDENINKQKCCEQQGGSFRYHHEQWFAAVPDNGGTVSGAETTSTNSVMEEFCSAPDVNSASARDGSCSNAKGQESDSRKQFTFASGFENLDGKKFSFSASSVQSNSPATKRRQRKKYREKVGFDSFVITPSSNVKLGSSSLQFSTQVDGTLHFDTSQGQQGNVYASQDKRENKCQVDERVKKGSVSSNTTIQEMCEKWRLRGNQAYKNDYLPKAEEYYTRGINSVPASERSGSCLKPLVLCYSNRAATRMSLGRIREAIGDCTIAAALDPDFLKVQMRAANCHLLLGDVDNALQCFNKCVESGARVCLDRRLMVEAAEGLQKAQKVAEGAKTSAKLLEQKTSDAALSALKIIAESLSVCSYSEELLKMKAEALSVLRRHEEVIQLCEQTISFAEKNFDLVSTHIQSANMDGATCERSSSVKLWRWFLISKSYFYMGRLEAALERLEKLRQSGSISDKFNIVESSISLGATIRELLRCKNEGNEAFNSGRYSEAIEHYTVALSSNVESRPFSAICFCNRAAAHQALGQIADAIADCSLSLALDASYAKAVSRRATLHEMIRDYAQAASDLQRLVSILENQSGEKVKSPGTGSRSGCDAKELRQAHRRMSLMEEEAKKRIPLNLYLILGIKQSDSASDIKKAYHKAALKHHPDKAGQFLAKSESGDEGQLWKEIAQEVYKDADRLFKMIGEAYAVLSDPSKRSEYDLEEELRNIRKSHGSGSSAHKKTSDAYSNYPFERSRRNWQESWKTYGSSYSRF